MPQRLGWVLASSLALMSSPMSQAGDPAGVADTIRGIAANWPDAYFSIDVAGPTNGQAIVKQPVEIEYEAAAPGYLTYLRITSHGDMTLVRKPSVAVAGSVKYLAEAPLGNEQVVVLFSNTPLNALFSGGEEQQSLGADRASAAAFVNRLTQLEAGDIKIAARRYHYEVAAPPGATEYTTRGLTDTLLGGGTPYSTRDAQSKCLKPHWTAPAKGDAEMFPAHVEFAFDSDQITAQGKLDLDVVGSVLASSQFKDGNVELQGNTDGVGAEDYNMELSARRAVKVKEYLQDSFGIAAARLRTVGMGKSNPAMPNDNDEGRACNRRVDFIISRPQPQTAH